jgi:hypothetical protein
LHNTFYEFMSKLIFLEKSIYRARQLRSFFFFNKVEYWLKKICWNSGSVDRVARVFLIQYTKTMENIAKLPLNYKMAIKYTKLT